MVKRFTDMAKKAKKDPRGRKTVKDKMVQISFYRRQSAIKKCGGMAKLLSHLNNEVDNIVTDYHVTKDIVLQGDHF